MALELGLLWTAVILYLAASLMGWVGLIWRWDKLLAWTLVPTGLGLVVQAVFVVLRWLRIGHGPYINSLEVLSASVWVGAALLLYFMVRHKDLRAAVGPVLGLSVVLLGWAVLSSPDVEPLPPTFKGVWLIIHILFAKIAYGSILVASAFAVQYLIKHHRLPDEPDAAEKAELKNIDRRAANLTILGFIAVTFMIAAGAIWARDAWGHYWRWDPIETWALVTWVAYGLFLHSRMVFKMRGVRSAWAVLGLLALSIMAFFVIAVIAPTIHTEFMVN